MTVTRQDGLNAATVDKAPLAIEPAGVQFQTLTTEQRSGGTHRILHFPQGWRAKSRGYAKCSIDLYILEGELRIRDATLRTGSYVYVPEGVNLSLIEAPTGCRALVVLSKPWEFVAGDASAEDADDSRAIGPIETWTLPWMDPMKEVVKKSTWTDDSGKSARPPGVLTKTLRHFTGPKDREMVALTALAPGYVDPGTEHHPHDECLYLVAGDCYIGLTYDFANEIRNEDVVIGKDHFLARPPMIKHGPVCTQSGALWFLYMNDRYTGLFEEVDGWQDRVRGYLTSASYK